MVDAKTRLLAPALALLAGVALSGCEASKDGDSSPPPPPEAFVANFSVTTAIPVLPFPTDLMFSGSTDGTLNIPSALGAPIIFNGAALNDLDGWSTTASMITSFNVPIRADTITASSVRIVELYLSNTTKGPAQGAELPAGVTSPVRRVLQFGTDFSAGVSESVDSGGKVLEITPLKPLTASTGATNIGYLILLTNDLTDVALRPAQPSADYAAVKAAPADCSTITNATLNGVCRLTKGHLAIGTAIGVSPADVVLSWSFTTQSVDDSFRALDMIVPAQPIGVVATGLTTQQVNAALQGKANLYVGQTSVPYYLTKPATVNDGSYLTSTWVAAGPSPVPGLDPASRHITRFNPVPLNRGDTTIPLLVTVPNAAANPTGGGCSRPAAGWPVAIVQHGLGGNRTQALAMADSFADACFVVAAIDLPLHGLTDTASPLYQAANERTFNVDLVNNTNTSSRVPDGLIDPSGTHAIPIVLSSPRTARDTLRQGQADIGVLAKSLANLDLTGDSVSDVDGSRIHFVGLSLGGIAGIAQAKYSSVIRTVTVSAPGGVITRLLLDSPTFGATVRGGVLASFAANPASATFPNNGSSFNQLFREIQTLVDPGDPINHICECAGLKPLHLQKINGDTVVPNNSTDRLITAGNLFKVSTLGPTPVGPGRGAWTAFTAGSHGTLFDPTASMAATVEAQRQAVLFAASAVQPGGPFVVITDVTVIE